jgi:hypothetical protein
MYSIIVYLMGEKYVPMAKTLDWKEVLANGTKVNQKKLAELMILAAFIYLLENKFITLYFKEDQFLFFKSKNIYIKKNTEDNGTLSGIESYLLSAAKREEKVFDLLSTMLHGHVQNPWQKMIEIVKHELHERGTLSISGTGKSIFGTAPAKLDITNEYPNIQTLVHNWNQAFESFKIDSPLYEKMQSEIGKSLIALLEQNAAGTP